MTILEMIIIAVGLAMDASAVSLAAASAGFAGNIRAKFRLAFHFGLFQFLMPILGWWIGKGFVSYLKFIDHWIAFGLLAFVGGRMIAEGFGGAKEGQKKDPSRGMTMVMLSVATSIDAMAVGLGLAILEVNVWQAAGIIGVITAAMSLAAIQIGLKLGEYFENKMEIAGGVILIGIGGKILLSHLIAGT